MDQTEDSEVTRMLHDAAAGVPGSLDRLIEAVYEDLRALARASDVAAWWAGHDPAYGTGS
ncbi:MAG: hypothetical protein ACK44Z_08555 [Pirellulaceae bacterium]